MIKQQDIKTLLQINGFLGGIACMLEDLHSGESAVSCQIEMCRVEMGNVIERLEKEYERESANQYL